MKIVRFVLNLFILLSLMVVLLPAMPPQAHATNGTDYYDFIAHAPEASWSSGGGSLSFPGRTDDSRGFACYRESIELEDGVTYGRVLETHPNWADYGHIQGTYPEMTVMSGTELVIWVGFLDGAAGTDGVHFQVNFHFWSGDRRITTAVASVDAYYDGHLTFERVSLDGYAGKTGQFTLYAGAGPSSGKDWAVWAQAEITPVRSPVLILTDCPLPDATRGQAYSVRLEGTKRIELQDKDGNVLASREVSSNKPEVQVLYPNGGEAFAQGEKIRVRWQASDEDGDALTYSLAMSADGGETWLPIDVDITNDEYQLDTDVLEVGQNYLIRVRATDGVNTAEDVSDGAFTITEAVEAKEGGISTWLIIVIVIAVVAVAGVVAFWLRRPKRA